MYVENTIPYLGGAINGCTDEEANNWRDDLLKHFPNALNPMRRDYRGMEDDCTEVIVELDKEDIENSDFAIFNVSKPSWGTAMEILYAFENGVPVIVWCPEDMVISPWVRYHSDYIVHSKQELFDALDGDFFALTDDDIPI